MTSRQPIVLATLLCPGLQAQDKVIPQRYDYSYQLYQEDSDRIRVESSYIRGQIEIDDAMSFRFQWLNDAISGASPTGVLPGGTQPFLSNVEDVRVGILGALSRQFGDHRVELEVSKSSEHDYISHGYALTDTLELNQKNTTVAYGVNYLDDTVSVPKLPDTRKESFDFFTGVTQILDKDTVVTANLTVGYANGYLNDPYKVVQRNEVLQIPDGNGGFIDLPVTNIYRENRPDSRLREVLQFEGKRYVEKADGAIDAVLRLSHDDYGILSETVQLEWRQNIGGHFQAIPFFRYSHQNAADFYMTTINGLSFATAPSSAPNGSGPNYSADYRLSSLDAISLGLRLRYQITDQLAATACFERYTMSGSGSGSDVAPEEAYPSADIWTLGLSVQF
ncbi:MAG: DUF3570 domain-containing protein [Luteolibacter sp.]